MPSGASSIRSGPPLASLENFRLILHIFGLRGCNATTLLTQISRNLARRLQTLVKAHHKKRTAQDRFGVLWRPKSIDVYLPLKQVVSKFQWGYDGKEKVTWLLMDPEPNRLRGEQSHKIRKSRATTPLGPWNDIYRFFGLQFKRGGRDPSESRYSESLYP